MAVPVASAQKIHLSVDVSKPGAKIDRNLFGQFAEHLGHGVYEGIWVGPDSKIPNTRGIRNDVVAALKALKVRTCGYAGLMLPVLEDPVLAQRAGEGRFGVRDLLLYSSVCGTGLDLVPIPGDTPPEVITRVIRDVAALAARWQKALSARLFLVPGKQPGQSATFDDPVLTHCTVLPVS